MKNKILITSMLMLSACSQNVQLDDYSHYLRNKDIPIPTTEKLPHCFNYGCKTIRTVSIGVGLQKELKDLFSPLPDSAEEERYKISNAIGVFEQHIGNMTGTKADLKGTFKPFTRKTDTPLKFQQDCVDESTNTTVYLSYLSQKNWLKFHRVTQPQSRQPFMGGNSWWHQSATIKDLKTNQQYAVDSWFEDNGTPAYIVPIEIWFNNWKPPESNRG